MCIKNGFMVFIATVIGAISGEAVAQNSQMPVLFVFKQISPKKEEKHFIFELRDPVKIAEARALITNPSNPKRHVQGVIDPHKRSYNPSWSFSLIPETIGFFEMQIEVCDANVTYVEEHLDEVGGAFLPRSFWCPWSSFIERELKP
jgi:hypothetical protein